MRMYDNYPQRIRLKLELCAFIVPKLPHLHILVMPLSKHYCKLLNGTAARYNLPCAQPHPIHTDGAR